ncbi:MAG TPA: matrixin family metalloprotease [Candidatus Obscuribacterales bacterium]
MHRQNAISLSTALGIFLTLMIAFCAPRASKAETTFFVNGKQVSAATYQAYALTNSAAANMRKNNPRGAIADLRHALDIEPTFPQAHGLLAITLARVGKTQEATDEFQMAIVGNPQAIGPRLNLASLYQTTGHLKEALKAYEQLVQDFPQSNQMPAVQERIKLLRAEIDEEARAGAHDDNRYDAGNYLGNIAAGGIKRWPEAAMPLKVFVSSGEGLNGYNSNYQSILEESFREWEKSSQGKVRFEFCNSPGQADISCEWVDNADKLGSSAEGGEAEMRCLGSAICKAHIILSVIDAGSAFPLTGNLVRILCLHEVGHSLGLLGHSGRPQDIMFCTSPIIDKERHVSAADVSTLNLLYDKPLDPGSQLLARIERESHGNAVSVIRLIIIMVCAVVAAIATIAALAKARKKKPRTKSSV